MEIISALSIDGKWHALNNIIAYKQEHDLIIVHIPLETSFENNQIWMRIPDLTSDPFSFA